MNKNIKFVIAGLMIVLGIYLIWNRSWGWGIVSILLAGIPILLYYKNEYILLAFWQLRNQKIEKANEWLSKIVNFEGQLHRSQFGYYHYLKGLVIVQDNPTKAEPLMKKALEYGLNMKQDRAMATLNLAAMALSRGRKQEGQKLLEEAKRLDSAGLMTDQIKMLKDQIKLPSVQKHMHNPHMRMRGRVR